MVIPWPGDTGETFRFETEGGSTTGSPWRPGGAARGKLDGPDLKPAAEPGPWR